MSTKSDLLQVPADLILNLRREALRDYLTACEDAKRAGEEMLANADRPPSEQAPAIDLAAELVRHRAHVEDAEHALEMVGDDLQTVEAWEIDVTAHRGGAGLIADVIDREDDTITESSHADPDEIDAARERITRLHTLLSDLARTESPYFGNSKSAPGSSWRRPEASSCTFALKNAAARETSPDRVQSFRTPGLSSNARSRLQETGSQQPPRPCAEDGSTPQTAGSGAAGACARGV